MFGFLSEMWMKHKFKQVISGEVGHLYHASPGTNLSSFRNHGLSPSTARGISRTQDVNFYNGFETDAVFLTFEKAIPRTQSMVFVRWGCAIKDQILIRIPVKVALRFDCFLDRTTGIPRYDKRIHSTRTDYFREMLSKYEYVEVRQAIPPEELEVRIGTSKLWNALVLKTDENLTFKCPG